MATIKPHCSITVSRQMGSLGFEIAKCLSDHLGYRLVWREIINQAAQIAGVPEVALAAIDELGLLGFCPSPDACQSYRSAVEEIMKDLARRGDVVIIGRAGQIILAGWPNTLHIRVIAPETIRIQRVAERQKIPLDAAREQILSSDRFRKNYLKKFYNIVGDDPNLYDLVINTSQLSSSEAALVIAHTLEVRFQQSTTMSSSIDFPPKHV